MIYKCCGCQFCMAYAKGGPNICHCLPSPNDICIAENCPPTLLFLLTFVGCVRLLETINKRSNKTRHLQSHADVTYLNYYFMWQYSPSMEYMSIIDTTVMSTMNLSYFVLLDTISFNLPAKMLLAGFCQNYWHP